MLVVGYAIVTYEARFEKNYHITFFNKIKVANISIIVSPEATICSAALAK